MSTKLKEFFGRETVGEIAHMIDRVSPDFDGTAFQRAALGGLSRLELMPRAHHIARALRAHLPPEYARAVGIIRAALGPPLENTRGNGMAPFLYLPFVLYVAEYGLDDVEASLDLQYELTRRFSAEFSIRAFLERHPEPTMLRLHAWARDPDPHVRRLVSEGTRPRLPWARRLRAFQQDPAPVLALLELLKDDPELYVRRSVANNLNDIGKDHPGILEEVCRRWLVNATPERQWIVQHALRSAIKRGETGALRVSGFHERPAVGIEDVRFTPSRAAIGGTVRFTCRVVSLSRKPQSLLIDFAVKFPKANGTKRPKVFKLRRLSLEAGGEAALAGSVTLRQLSTRTHYPGRHDVALLINGIEHPIGSFSVTRARR